MLRENTEKLQQFFYEKKANGIKDRTLKTYMDVLPQLDAFLDKPFMDATKEDMIRFVVGLQDRCKHRTVHMWKTRIKCFYSWLFGLDRGEYPACVKWMRSTNPGRGTKTKGYEMAVSPEDVLTQEDVLRLVDASDHPRDQALIMVMYETACEPTEALNMKVKSVLFDQKGAVVSLEGEAGVRRIRVVDSVPYLQTWLNVHVLRKDPEAPLWLLKKGGLVSLGYHGLWRLVSKLKGRSGLKKPVRPNLLRHARLTEMAKFLPEQKLKVFAGWTPDSRMAAVYVHLAGKDLDEDILAMHGKAVAKPEAPLRGPLTPRKCPRCRHENPATYMWCGMCGQQLDVTLNETKTLERDLWLNTYHEVLMELRDKEGAMNPDFYKIMDMVQARIQAKKKGAQA